MAKNLLPIFYLHPIYTITTCSIIKIKSAAKAIGRTFFLFSIKKDITLVSLQDSDDSESDA